MANILLTRQAVLLVKSETTNGSFQNPDASNAVLTTIPTFSFDIETYEREMSRSSLSPLPPRLTNIDVNISFSCEIKNTDDNNAPEVAPLLKACGFHEYDETSTEAGVYIYGLKTEYDDIKSCSMEFYWGGHMYDISGCIGNVSCAFEAGGIGLYTFEMKGKYRGHAQYSSNTSMITDPVYDTSLPPLCSTAEVSWGGDTNLDCSKLEFSLNNEIQAIRNLGDAEPTSQFFFISSRKPSGSMDPLCDKSASPNPDWIPLLEDSTQKKASIILNSGSGNHEVAFYFGGAKSGADIDQSASVNEQNVVTGLTFDDDAGVRRFGITFAMTGTFLDGDDELWIKYT